MTTDVPSSASSSSRGRRIRPLDRGVAAGLGLAYVVVLWVTAGDLAMSRDESFYVIAAERYADWLAAGVQDPGTAFRRPAIDAAWSTNAEHPPLMKLLFALSWNLQQVTGWFPTDAHAFRFPGMVSGGLLLWVVYLFAVELTGRRDAAAFAALTVATMPRVFYHAHLNAFDVPIAAMIALATWTYWRSLVDPRRAVVFGLVYGLTLATKHNSWILPGIFLIHFGWLALRERRARRAGIAPEIDLRPWWLAAMIGLGPLVLVSLWPWLWHDTLPRFGAYARFHLNHAYYNMAYFGENHFLPPFPVSFPFVMTAITVPATVLALAATGVGVRLRALVPPGLEGWRWARRLPGEVADARATDVLLMGSLLAPLVVIALPSSPIFGATKHWFPSYPFVAIYAGLGFAWATDRLRASWPASRGWVASVGAGAIALAPGLVESAHAHPHGLSHYTPLAGGVPGAADLGMNRQFWGFTHGPLVGWIADRLPNGGRVWICDATAKSWEMLQRDGLLPDDIRATGAMAMADLVLVHHEHHFAEVDFQVWQAFGSVRPAEVLTYDGVPIVSVYENPTSRKLARPDGDEDGPGGQGRSTSAPVR